MTYSYRIRPDNKFLVVCKQRLFVPIQSQLQMIPIEAAYHYLSLHRKHYNQDLGGILLDWNITKVRLKSKAIEPFSPTISIKGEYTILKLKEGDRMSGTVIETRSSVIIARALENFAVRIEMSDVEITACPGDQVEFSYQSYAWDHNLPTIFATDPVISKASNQSTQSVANVALESQNEGPRPGLVEKRREVEQPMMERKRRRVEDEVMVDEAHNNSESGQPQQFVNSPRKTKEQKRERFLERQKGQGTQGSQKVQDRDNREQGIGAAESQGNNEYEKNEISKSSDEVHRDEVHRDKVHRNEVHRDEVHRDEVYRDGVHRDEVHRDEVCGDEDVEVDVIVHEADKTPVRETQDSGGQSPEEDIMTDCDIVEDTGRIVEDTGRTVKDTGRTVKDTGRTEKVRMEDSPSTPMCSIKIDSNDMFTDIKMEETTENNSEIYDTEIQGAQVPNIVNSFSLAPTADSGMTSTPVKSSQFSLQQIPPGWTRRTHSGKRKNYYTFLSPMGQNYKSLSKAWEAYNLIMSETDDQASQNRSQAGEEDFVAGVDEDVNEDEDVAHLVKLEHEDSREENDQQYLPSHYFEEKLRKIVKHDMPSMDKFELKLQQILLKNRIRFNKMKNASEDNRQVDDKITDIDDLLNDTPQKTEETEEYFSFYTRKAQKARHILEGSKKLKKKKKKKKMKNRFTD